jgi:hypothetical protein
MTTGKSIAQHLLMLPMKLSLVLLRRLAIAEEASSSTEFLEWFLYAAPDYR